MTTTTTTTTCTQISDQFKALGAGMSLRECVVIGGMEQQQQARELMRRPHVVIATPGRLASLLASDSGLAKGFSRTRWAGSSSWLGGWHGRGVKQAAMLHLAQPAERPLDAAAVSLPGTNTDTHLLPLLPDR